jgi:hypothetical protein
MRPNAAPLSEQIVIILFGPPIMAVLWWVASRNLARILQGGSVSEKTEGRLRKQFWVYLVALYILGLGIFLYAALTRH